MLNLLDADVLEGDVAHEVVVATVDGQTSLIIHLWLCLSEYVDVLVVQVLDGVATLCIAVDADEDGVSHIGPERGIAHGHIAAVAEEAFARGVGCGAVVRVATEHAIVEHVLRGEHVQSVAPARMGDALHVAQGDAVGCAHGTCVQRQPVDEYIPRAMHMTAFVAPLRTGYATSYDTYIVGILDGEGAGEVGTWCKIYGRV